MTKIIGFLITKENIDINVDIFTAGIKYIRFKHANYYIYLWGLGDIESYKINGKYTLSFPLHDSLLDRNVLISLRDNEIVIENDWLGSIPVFYNKKYQIVSTISNFCIKDKEIHKEGLANFCEFGYSVFEQTIFEDIQFMRYFSRLNILNDRIQIEYKNDPVLENCFLTKKSTTEEVISLMQDYVDNVEKETVGDIVLPTSGGYDSRILNYLVNDKSRIRSFTYGISKVQSKSTEVVHAKKISEIFNTKWEQIELENFHKYIDKWFDIYGISTHTHGMYHIEFYTKILEKYNLDNPSFLSGIFGDVWAGSVIYKDIKTFQDLIILGYTHGMHLDVKHLNIKHKNTIKEHFFLKNKEALKNGKMKAVFTIRMKLMVISYLTQIPEYFGMPVWTPFLNFEIVKSTLNLPDEIRKNRIWQRDFFKKVKLNLEDMRLKSIKNNHLNCEVAKKTNFKPIEEDLLKEYISKDRLVEINNNLEKLNRYEVIKNYFLYLPKIGGLLRKKKKKNEFLKALHEYYVIKAIEKGLRYES